MASFYKPVRVFSFLVFSFLTGFLSEGKVCRVTFEASEDYESVTMAYRLIKGESYEPDFRYATMEKYGTRYWHCELDLPEVINSMQFYSGDALIADSRNTYDKDWSKGVCYHQDDKAITEDVAVFFNFVDRYGWLEGGAEDVLVSTFPASAGTLTYAGRDHSSNDLTAEADFFVLDAEGHAAPDGRGMIYPCVLFNPRAGDEACLWMRRKANESDAVLAVVKDGETITQQSAPAPAPLYAYYTIGSGFNLENPIAVPYRDGEYVVDWQFAEKKRDGRNAQILFSLGRGTQAEIVAGGLRVAPNSTGIENTTTNQKEGYKKFTQPPLGLRMSFTTPGNQNPTLSFPNDRNCTPSGDYPFFGRIAIRFDEGITSGTMRFDGISERPIDTELVQISENDVPTFSLRLSARWKDASKFRLSDGRTTNQAVKAVALRSADPRAISEIARILGTQPASDCFYPSIIIDDSEFLARLKSGETATLELPSARPGLDYSIWLDPIPDDAVNSEEWMSLNMLPHDTDSFDSSVLRTEIPAPAFSFSDIRYSVVDVPEELQLPDGAEPGIGNVKPRYPRAVVAGVECSLNTPTALPDGWSGKFRLLDAQGNAVTETADGKLSVSGLSSSDRDELRAVWVLSDGVSEVTSPSEFRPEQLPESSNLPSYDFNGSCAYLFNRSPVGYPSNVGTVYDLVLEQCFNIHNPGKLPICLDLSIDNPDAANHSSDSHMAAGHTNTPRLTNPDETYVTNDGSLTITGNATLNPGDGLWQYSLAEASRAVAFIHHFHCTGRTSNPRPVSLTIRPKLILPTLVPESLQIATAESAMLRKAESRATGYSLVLTEIPTTDKPQEATIDLSTIDNNNVATGLYVSPSMPAQGPEIIHELNGRRLNTPPSSGFYILNSTLRHK